MMLECAIAIFLLPLFGLLVMTFSGAKMYRRGDWLACVLMLGSLLLSGYLFVQMLGSPEPIRINVSIEWLRLGAGKILPAGILLDNLTIVMLCVVTIVSFVVYLFSIGYMHGDSRYGRYFTYLLLFSTSMLGLILANNLLVLYVFWELVGLSSYLLIGFWFEKDSAKKAAIKAFITTRIGDVGMFFAILIIWMKVGSLEYGDIFKAVADGTISGTWHTIAGLGIFLGAMGKSAQFPLHVWLPDAMEGPTPISALIHAATMVAAGVYLVGRMFLFFNPQTLLFIAIVGAITAFFAATIAFVMDDIKRVLAYSTISQLGYMMLALGVGSFVAGLFHLATHAMFKALLFLGSGSVIHAAATQSMNEMGGLRKKMPVTTVTFLIATLALCGCPFLSGFYSKDLIIAKSLEFGLLNGKYIWLFILAAGTAGMTAFYMFRLFFKTFMGEPRDAEKHAHAHESPWTMCVPLIILAIFTVAAGWGGGAWFKDHNPEPTLASYGIEIEAEHTLPHAESAQGHSEVAASHATEAAGHDREHIAHIAHKGAMISSLVLAGLGVLGAYLMFGARVINSRKIADAIKPIYTVLWRKYYIDEFYHIVFIKTLHATVWVMGAFDLYIIDGIVNFFGTLTRFSAWIIGKFDNIVVDGAVNGTAWTTAFVGNVLSFFQTGKVRNYVFLAIIGILILTGVLVFAR